MPRKYGDIPRLKLPREFQSEESGELEANENAFTPTTTTSRLRTLTPTSSSFPQTPTSTLRSPTSSFFPQSPTTTLKTPTPTSLFFSDSTTTTVSSQTSASPSSPSNTVFISSRQTLTSVADKSSFTSVTVTKESTTSIQATSFVSQTTAASLNEDAFPSSTASAATSTSQASSQGISVVAQRFLIALGIIAGLATILLITLIFRRRKKGTSTSKSSAGNTSNEQGLRLSQEHAAERPPMSSRNSGLPDQLFVQSNPFDDPIQPPLVHGSSNSRQAFANLQDRVDAAGRRYSNPFLDPPLGVTRG